MDRKSFTNTMTRENSRMNYKKTPKTDFAWYAASQSLEKLANGFDPISLEEMDAVALLNRVDTKFVMSNAQLLRALAALQQEYRIVSVNGHRLNHYRTLYFDTKDFALYNLHINDRTHYYKVRSREYTDSQVSFLEVKKKTYKNRTIKNRIPTDEPVVQMTMDAEHWLSGEIPYESSTLEPKLWNTFTRITLVHKCNCERVTLDIDLSFYTPDKMEHLDGVAIAEVKMDGNNRNSAFIAQMRAQKIHPQGFSKYCVGVSMLYDQVKKNALKPKLMQIEKISKGYVYHE